MLNQRRTSQTATAGKKNDPKPPQDNLPPPPIDNPQTQTLKETPTDLDFGNAYDGRKWLVDYDLLSEEDEVPTLHTLADILIDMADSPSKRRADIETTMRAVGVILQFYSTVNEQERAQREEGELNEGEDLSMVRDDNNNIVSEMKHALQTMEEKLQDRVDRAIKALEETAKDYREKVATLIQPQQTYSQIAQQAPHTPTHPQQQLQRQAPPPPAEQHNALRAQERAKTRAKQLVLDIDSDHVFAKSSNVGIRDECRKALKAANAPTDYDILAVTKLRKGGILLETNKEDTANWLKIKENSERFRQQIQVKSDFTKRTYAMIAKFVQCTFDPEDQRHIEDLKDENCWDSNLFAKARWAKPIERRTPHQTHAHLIITLNDENAVNSILANRGHIYIWGRRIQVEKDRCTPMRCAKCQKYGHYVSDCLQQEDTCARCAAKGHRSQECDPRNTPRCANCNEDGHEAYSNQCPIFQKKLTQYNERTPENTMPLYPTSTHTANNTSNSRANTLHTPSNQ